MTDQERHELLRRIQELEARVGQLEHENLEFEREVARRGVKLSCANIALSRAKLAFDEQARHRNEAIQDIAHDLRTPLTAIKGAASNVLDGIAGQVEPRVACYVEIIHSQSQRLMGVVNWLLQAIRITSEARSLEASFQNLGEVVAHAVQSLAPIAESRGLKLSVAAPDIVCCFDAPKIALVLDNLIGNALKFTDAGGGVRVSLNDHEDEVSISVTDTGIGMDEDALDRIFHRYYRADPEREGSGLGLLIARELVRLHRGDITVESELGKGSRFVIVLPKAQPGEHVAAQLAG
jgi:two-component system phosphate regulon sensor histidine kinase PhoR